MKKVIYTIMCLMLMSITNVIAQNDTLLYENFSTPFDAMPFDNGVNDGVSNMLSGSDTSWVNFDADGIPAGGSATSNKWFWDSLDFVGDNLGVLKSQSWLQGFSPDNRNWLILPRLKIVDATAVLQWKSAPYQGPRYMDGYTILVSTTNRNVNSSPNPFVDTLFHAAEMTGVSASPSLVLSDYQFSDGYIHANSYTDSMYFIHPGETADYTTAEEVNLGQLEPHSISLAAYAGRNIHIAFLHDSENDNLIELDDILVTGTMPVANTKNISATIGLEVFPNPTRDYLTLSYEVVATTDIAVQVFDMQGRLMQVYNNVSSTVGKHQHRIQVSDFPVGSYNIVITTDNQRLTKRFVKQ